MQLLEVLLTAIAQEIEAHGVSETMRCQQF